MTEKRFTLAYSDDSEKSKWWAVRDGDITLWKEEVVYLLNQLYEENEQLKKELDKLKVVNEMLSMDFANSEHELWKENEQLKNKLKFFNELNKPYGGIIKENEQLKQQKDKWKQQCIHFKEMLDDMDIAYLCDEWIYEELKGDVE